MPARSSEARAQTRTALPQGPGSTKHISIPLSKLRSLVTKLYSEKRIIRTDMKSASRSDTEGGLEDRFIAHLIRMNGARLPLSRTAAVLAVGIILSHHWLKTNR